VDVNNGFPMFVDSIFQCSFVSLPACSDVDSNFPMLASACGQHEPTPVRLRCCAVSAAAAEHTRPASHQRCLPPLPVMQCTNIIGCLACRNGDGACTKCDKAMGYESDGAGGCKEITLQALF
jgi:hypothetical protein